MGSGQFGSVKSGTWNTGKSEVKVAVKSLNQGISEETRVKFLQEAAIMAQFKHPNIVTLHGVASDKEPVSRLKVKLILPWGRKGASQNLILYMNILQLMLVVELMHRGDLRDHLHSIRPE
ncbi:MAG: protein kinase [Proteobacteria bacterium]|nr:protein kinase [Pseudomonadota bacterium]